MDDPAIARLFYDAGVMLGKQMKALVKKIPDEDMVGKMRERENMVDKE